MQNITSTIELKEAIRLLEDEQTYHGRMLKEEFNLSLIKVTRASLITGTIKEVIASPGLAGSILSVTLGLTAGYFSKKVMIGFSGNLFKRLFGNILQLGVTNFIAKNPAMVKAIGQNIIYRIFNKKTARSRK